MIQSGSGGAHQVAAPQLSNSFSFFNFHQKLLTFLHGVTTDQGRGGRAGINKNVTNAGSQLTWEGGRAGISKNVTNFVTNAGSQLTF